MIDEHLLESAKRIADVLHSLPNYANFTDLPKDQQYGLLFQQTINGLPIKELAGGEDEGLHLVGLVRYRLNHRIADISVNLPQRASK